MNTLRFAVRLAALSAGLFICGAAGFMDRAEAASGRLNFRVGEERRSALIVERSRLKRQLRPALIVLPAVGVNSNLARRSVRFDQFTRSGGILVQGQPLRGAWRPDAEMEYVRALVREVVSKSLADPRRIYIVGVGSGGLVALQAACRDGKLFAGVGAILGALPADAAAGCAPGKPLPAMLIAGTADKRVPFAGGLVDLPDFKGEVAGAEASLAPFAQAAGCSDKRTRTNVQDRDRVDGSRVVIEQFDGCKAAVRLVRIEGGAHVAPTLAARGPRISGQNRDISATRMVLNFFRLPGGV